MSSTIVLDSSALLATIFDEPGADRVDAVLDRAAISAINLAEVATRLIDKGRPPGDVAKALARQRLKVVDFDADLALLTAGLRDVTRHLGLSLGDRACLATARRLGVAVMTADRSWSALDLGIEIELIR